MSQFSRSHTPELASEDKECTGAPSFCNYAAGTCNLLVINRASVDFFSSAINFLSMEVVDNLVSKYSQKTEHLMHDHCLILRINLSLIKHFICSCTHGLRLISSYRMIGKEL